MTQDSKTSYILKGMKLSEEAFKELGIEPDSSKASPYDVARVMVLKGFIETVVLGTAIELSVPDMIKIVKSVENMLIKTQLEAELINKQQNARNN